MRVFKLTARTASGSETIVWEHARTMTDALLAFANREVGKYALSVTIVMERNTCNVGMAHGNCGICNPR